MTGRLLVVGVIGDDASVRGALHRLFRTAGLETSLFATAEDYLAYPERAALDCLVIDVRLPGIDGLELLERTQGQCLAPALVVTAREDEQTRGRALAAGAIEVFGKPFDNCKIKAAVFQALRLRGDEARHEDHVNSEDAS